MEHKRRYSTNIHVFCLSVQWSPMLFWNDFQNISFCVALMKEKHTCLQLRGWVNDDRIFIFEWTTLALKILAVSFEHYRLQYRKEQFRYSVKFKRRSQVWVNRGKILSFKLWKSILHMHQPHHMELIITVYSCAHTQTQAFQNKCETRPCQTDWGC